jgi:hypothetical protein
MKDLSVEERSTEEMVGDFFTDSCKESSSATSELSS